MKTRNEIQNSLELLQSEINAIKYQLEINCNLDNKVWEAKARSALRFRQLDQQKLIRELSEINRKEKEERLAKSLEDGKRFDRVFLYTAKEFIEPDVYNRIIEESRRRVGLLGFDGDGEKVKEAEQRKTFLRMFGLR